MCDCEELEYEDFETMLNVISKLPQAKAAEEPVQAPLIKVSARKK